MESIFYECLALSVDAFVFGLFYKMYQLRSQDAKALQNAPCLTIDSTLSSKVKASDNCIPYAVVSGTVKATSNALQSRCSPGVTGVIQELITKEQKLVWSPFFRLWTKEEDVVHRSKNFVPFALIGSSSSSRWWFEPSSVRVEITDPVFAEELTLTNIQSTFTPHERSVREIIAGWLTDEQTTGIIEEESMLTENSLLIGAGTLVLEGDTLKLKPPRPAYMASYFLTPLPLDSLLNKVKGQVTLYKIISWNCAAVGVFILSYIMLKFYRAHKRELEKRRLLQRRHENLVRQGENSSRTDSENPTCVICLTNPIEAIVLECGHACLCVGCSDGIGVHCPVCRAVIDRIVPAYLP